MQQGVDRMGVGVLPLDFPYCGRDAGGEGWWGCTEGR